MIQSINLTWVEEIWSDLSQKWALNFFIFPSGNCFILKAQVECKTFLNVGHGNAQFPMSLEQLLFRSTQVLIWFVSNKGATELRAIMGNRGWSKGFMDGVVLSHRSIQIGSMKLLVKGETSRIICNRKIQNRVDWNLNPGLISQEMDLFKTIQAYKMIKDWTNGHKPEAYDTWILEEKQHH